MTRLGVASAAAALLIGAGAIAAWRTEPEPELDTAAAAGTVDRAATGTVGGADLFKAKGCGACHAGPDSEQGVGGVPPLTDAASWAGERRPPLTAEEYLAESIGEPWAFRSPAFGAAGAVTSMPAIPLSEAEIDALVVYLLQG